MSIKSGGGRGGRRRGKRHAPMSEINVTPFVDVMLVLLIIFMVAAPMMTGGVPVDLPKGQASQLPTPKQEPLVVTVAKDGKIYLGQSEEKKSLSIDELLEKLKSIKQARSSAAGRNDTEGDEPIYVKGDKDAEYGAFAIIMSRIKEAGFRKLSLVLESGTGG